MEARLREPPALQTHVRARRVQVSRSITYQVRLLDLKPAGCADALAEALGDRRALVVTTPTVACLYGRAIHARLLAQGRDAALLVLDCGERTKDLARVERICAAALDRSLDRRGVLVGLGGGVCTDLVTVAASWIRRGIPHLRVPTTLIGQIDAGLGAKGAVNFRGSKSWLGCFHPPGEVLVAPAFLRTLPREHLSAGFAEIVKIAVVRDPELMEWVEADGRVLLESAFRSPQGSATAVLWRSVLRMLEALEVNLYEDKTYERLVDFGHTFSPLLETASGFRLSHGQAVAIDMALSAALAEALGLADAATVDRVLGILRALELPTWSPELTPSLCHQALAAAALHRGGSPNLVLPTSIGGACFLKDARRLSAATLEAGVARVWRAQGGG